MRGLMLALLAVALIGCGAGPGREPGLAPNGPIAVPEGGAGGEDQSSTGGSLTGGAAETGGSPSGGVQATGGAVATGGVPAEMGGAQQATGGTNPGTGGALACHTEQVSACVAYVAQRMMYFADSKCTMQLFPTAAPMNWDSVVCTAQDEAPFAIVSVWTTGSQFEGTYWVKDASGCTATNTLPGYNYTYLVDSQPLSAQYRDASVCQ